MASQVSPVESDVDKTENETASDAESVPRAKKTKYAGSYKYKCKFKGDWTKQVIRVQKLVGLPPPALELLGVFLRFRITFAEVIRGCRRQPLYCFHFDFRYVTLVRYIDRYIDIYIYNMCSYA